MQLTHFIGCYQWTAGDGTAFRAAAGARLASTRRSRWTGIDRALWLTPAELHAERAPAQPAGLAGGG